MAELKLIRDAEYFRSRTDSPTVALTPTMGALHDGHLSLVHEARRRAELNVVSIYVNPLQFGAGEDFDSYPRDIAADCDKLRGLADVIFLPDTLYPVSQAVGLSLPPVADELCGRTRPGFFHGVATVVCKLFNCVQPDVALFGEKDFQQLHIVRMLAEQLNFRTKIISAPTVRETDGLAMSSRNAYLSAAERKIAALFPQALRVAAAAVETGMPPAQATAAAAATLTAAGFTVDYVEARDYETLSAPTGGRIIILAAVVLGKTRLIDNIECRLSENEKAER